MPWQTLSTIRRVGFHARGRRRIGVAILVGLALAAAGCATSTAGSTQPSSTPTQVPAITPTSTPTPQACTEWRVVASPNVTGTGYRVNELYAVSALSPTAAWAVGVGNQELSDPQSLIEQWDGTKWRIIPNSGCDVLKGVAAISPRNVWAVGGQLPLDAEDYHPHNPLILHWDGTRWSIVPSPSPGGPAELAGAVALAANDVWAVGAVEKDTSASHAHVQPLIEHWDGTAWQVVAGSTLSNGASGGSLVGVVALSATDAWAVGGYSGSDGTPRALIAHWDGTTWNLVTSPMSYASLGKVAAASATDVRAIGWFETTYGGTMDPLILQWNGSVWKQVTSPQPSGATSSSLSLSSITSDGAGNYWIVGSYRTPGHPDRSQTLTLYCP